MNDIIELIDKNKLFRDFDFLGAIPESGFELSKTRAYVSKSLLDMGIEASSCGRCGLTALIGPVNSKKTLLLRADMDAVYIGGKGVMHACGHHMHTAMLLAAARVLKAKEDKLKVRIKLMFQGAEEILEGALDMIDSGVLENPKVDAAFMLHVATGVDIKPGTAVFPSAGDAAPSADFFTITVTGKGTHGAEPSLGTDPIYAASQLVSSLGIINSRELKPFEPAVITIGSFNGGASANAIPNEVILKGTARAYNEANREFVKDRICRISKDVCSAMRCNCDVDFDSGCPSFLIDGTFLEYCVACATQTLGEENVIALGKESKGGGSEDFAYVSRRVPTVMASLAAGCKADGFEYPLHNPEVSFDKNALPAGSALLVGIALSGLGE